MIQKTKLKIRDSEFYTRKIFNEDDDMLSLSPFRLNIESWNLIFFQIQLTHFSSRGHSAELEHSCGSTNRSYGESYNSCI